VDPRVRPDMAPLPDLLHVRATAGPVRDRRPVYVDLLPPCNAGCPAGENIQAWLAHAEAGHHEQAWRQLTEDNPLPAIHGRVCYHPCEVVCNRASLDSAVSIHAVERFLGDQALDRGWTFDRPQHRTGKRVLVVGAGPSGLSAAYHLARLGHEVEIADAGDDPGGMMRYGIPAYRLPRDVLDIEIARIEALGVRITRGHRITDLDAEREGVTINWLRTITAFDGPELTVEAMELDETGFPRPTGRFETLAADTVILALGQDADTGFLRNLPGVEFARDGTVQVSPAMMTGCPGVFAGGDMVPALRTVTVGVGHGKKAARNIDVWLRGSGDTSAASQAKHDIVAFGQLNLWYFGDAAQRQQPEEAPEQRTAGFSEVVRRSVRARGGLRGWAVPVLRQLLRVRRLPGRLPRGRGDQARARAQVRVRLRQGHRLRRVLRAVPGACDRDGPRERVTHAALQTGAWPGLALASSEAHHGA
jgi:hypothetical protein